MRRSSGPEDGTTGHEAVTNSPLLLLLLFCLDGAARMADQHRHPTLPTSCEFMVVIS